MALSVLLAAVLAGAVGVAALRTDTASADTVLTRGDGAMLELADGTTRAAVVGERVPRGATVRAGSAGAQLQTRDREVWLGGATAVTVLDGARQELRSGFVMVDASGAPGLELETAAATVTTADDSLVRVDGGQLLRVGVLRGDEAGVRAAGRRASADVDTYHQVQVPAGGLPGQLTPFVLTPGDAYERQLAAELVRADDDLNALAARLDSDGAAGRAVLAALDEDVDVAVAAGSEGALGYLVARAADDGDIADSYARVRDLREAGGSWGIVAAIVSAPVDQVSAALGALLQPGTVPVVAGGPLDVDAVLELGGSGPGSTDDAPQLAPPAAPAPPGGGGTPPTEGPDPSPSPSPSPSDPVTTVVDEVVDAVNDLLPTPTPTSSPVPVLEPVLDLLPLEPLLR